MSKLHLIFFQLFSQSDRNMIEILTSYVYSTPRMTPLQVARESFSAYGHFQKIPLLYVVTQRLSSFPFSPPPPLSFDFFSVTFPLFCFLFFFRRKAGRILATGIYIRVFLGRGLHFPHWGIGFIFCVIFIWAFCSCICFFAF